MTQKFRKKPVVIEAIQFTQDNWAQVKEFTNNTAHSFRVGRNEVGYCIIPTLQGQHEATEGDYIIKGIAGEFYPCKPYIFVKTYELLN